MTTDRQQIEAFVEEWHKDPATTALVLAHAPPSSQAITIHTEALDAAARKKKKAASAIAEAFESAALSHATATGGVQRYTIAARAGVEVLAQHLFRLETTRQPLGLGLGDGDDLLRIDAKVFREMARQNQALHRLVVEGSEHQARVQARMLEDMGKRLEGAIGMIFTTQLDGAKLIQELLDRRHERDLEAARATRQDDRIDGLVDRISAALPMALASMSGSSPAAELLKSFSEEQRTAFFASLNDEQRELMGQILKTALRGEDGAKRLVAGVNDTAEGEAAAE